MFKAGQDSNRLSLQRERAVWFLLQDSSGVRWVSAADSLEIDSWDLSQAEQCWTTWAVIQGTSGVGGGGVPADVVYPSVKCVFVCGLLAEGHVPSVIRTAEWYSVPADLFLSTWGPINGSRRVKFQRNGNLLFFSFIVPCFLYWIFIIPCCHFLSVFI